MGSGEQQYIRANGVLGLEDIGCESVDVIGDPGNGRRGEMFQVFLQGEKNRPQNPHLWKGLENK